MEAKKTEEWKWKKIEMEAEVEAKKKFLNGENGIGSKKRNLALPHTY